MSHFQCVDRKEKKNVETVVTDKSVFHGIIYARAKL